MFSTFSYERINTARSFCSKLDASTSTHVRSKEPSVRATQAKGSVAGTPSLITRPRFMAAGPRIAGQRMVFCTARTLPPLAGSV